MSSHLHSSSTARRKKKRRSALYEDMEEDEGGISGWKLGVVVAVMVVCFAVIYPSVFHPLLMSLLGRNEPPAPARTDRPPMHPGMGGRGPPGSRGGEHPSMRMAAAQAHAEASKGGGMGGRGVYTWMIPIYTVGVIAFLLYTMCKPKNKKRRHRRDRDEFSSEEEEDVEEEYNGRMKSSKLRGLQERLRQTEDAMSKILEELEKAQAQGSLTQLSSVKKKSEPSKTKKKTVTKEKVVEEESSAQVEDIPSNNDSGVYMEDLEKALKDFKELSALYEQARGGKKKRDEDGDEDTESGETEEEEWSEEEEEIVNPFPQKESEEEDVAQEDEEEKVEGEEEEREVEVPRTPTPTQPARRRKARKD